MARYQTVFLTLLLMTFAVLLGFFSSQITPAKMIWGGVAFAVFAVTFLNVEYGLYILIFSMLLSPEIIVGETAGSSLGRGVTLRVEDFLLVVIGFSWFAKNAVDKDLGLFLKTPLNKAILFYSVVCMLATGFGIMAARISPKTGFFFVLKYIEYFIVFFMVANHVKSMDQIRRFVFCLLLTCFIVSIIGLLQIPGGGRVSAPFEGESGEPNTFGGYLMFMGMVAAGMLSQTKNTRTKHLLTALLLVILPPFLFTLSRASYLALIPALITLGYLMEKRVIVVGLILLGLFISPLFLPTPIKHRILYTFEQPEHRDQIVVGDVRLDTSTSARLRSWQEAIEDWTRHPLFGYGVTGYKFVDAQLPRVLAETGILGLAAFLYLLYCIGKLARSNLQKLSTPYARGICIGFMAGFVGLLFHAVGANTFIIVRIMEPFWFFTGMLVVLPMLEKTEPVKC
jgi:O-antigen ligase